MILGLIAMPRTTSTSLVPTLTRQNLKMLKESRHSCQLMKLKQWNQFEGRDDGQEAPITFTLQMLAQAMTKFYRECGRKTSWTTIQ